MSLLALLGAVISPDLSASERSRVRGLLRHQEARPYEDQPWPSGLIERPPVRTREQVLEERVEDLELAVKVLCDLLAERGALAADALPARVASVKQQLAAEEVSKEDEQRARALAARAAAEARTVACAGCGAVVRERESFLSSAGPLCVSCHHAREE